MNSYIDFGLLAKLLQRKRERRTLREMAQVFGDVSASTLSRIEAEKVTDMSMSTFLLICDGLEIHPSGLIRRVDEPQRIAQPERDFFVHQVRQSKVLSPRTASLIAAIIEAAYQEEERWSKAHALEDD